MTKTERKEQMKEKGQSLVELAVSLVILLILLAGIVDFGRIAFYYIAMRDAAQEGASYGIINPTDCTQIINRVRAGLVNDTVDVVVRITPTQIDPSTGQGNWSDNSGSSAGLTCNNAAQNHACEGNTIEVTVTDPNFPITMPLIGAFIGSQSIQLETTIRDTIIRPDCVNPGG